MHADKSGWVLQHRLQQTDGKARGVRRENGAGRDDGFQFAEELLLQLEILRHRFDNERARRKIVEAGGTMKTIPPILADGSFQQPTSNEFTERSIDIRLTSSVGATVGIVDAYCKPARQETRGNALAHQPEAHQANWARNLECIAGSFRHV